MNRGQIKARVMAVLGLSDTAASEESALVEGWINEGIVDLISRARPYTRKITLNMTVNTPIHDMSTQILALDDLEDGYGFLRRYSREDITRMQALYAWQPNQGVPGSRGFAYDEPLLWVSPVHTFGTWTLTAYGCFRPTPMSADIDDPANPTFGAISPEFQTDLIHYVLWKAGEYTSDEDSGMGEKYRIRYEGQDGMGGGLARIRKLTAKRVTPRMQRRRNPGGNMSTLSGSGGYVTAGGPVAGGFVGPNSP